MSRVKRDSILIHAIYLFIFFEKSNFIHKKEPKKVLQQMRVAKT